RPAAAMMSRPSLESIAMHDQIVLAQAAPSSPISDLANVPGDIEALPFLQHLAQVMPAADVAFGGGMLMLIILIHATGVRVVTGHVARRTHAIMFRPSVWRADLLMASSVLMLLALHLAETCVWAASLVYG